MKKILSIILLVSLFMIGNLEVNATSGRLRKDSIKTCNGITYGKHGDGHWHVASENGDGSYNASGNPIYSDPCSGGSNNTGGSSNTGGSNNTGSSNNNESTPPKEEPKSNDNTLKAIIIDGKEINIEDNIKYSTTKEKVSIKVSTTDEKATYKIKNNDNLSIGENKVIIEVTAEDGTIKTYNININREVILSSDTGIKVIIDDEEVIFDNYKSTVYVSSSATSINLDYKLNDKKAKVEMNKLGSLKTGDNELKIKVIAEDGSEQTYEIIIHKYTQTEDIISTIIVFAMFGGMGYGIYFLIKNFKTKKNNAVS